MSLFSTLGWVLRLAIVEVLLVTQVDPALGLLVLFRACRRWWPRPGGRVSSRPIQDGSAQHERRARHLFVLGHHRRRRARSCG